MVLGFIIGIFIGAFVGVLSMALLVASRDER